MTRSFLVPLVLPNDPQAAMEAATKQYADTKAPLRQEVPALAITTNYTLAAADEGKLLGFAGGAAITLTLPDNTSVPIPIGARFDVYQYGTSTKLTIAAGAGTSAIATGPTLRMAGSAASCIKTNTNLWLVTGDLA